MQVARRRCPDPAGIDRDPRRSWHPNARLLRRPRGGARDDRCRTTRPIPRVACQRWDLRDAEPVGRRLGAPARQPRVRSPGDHQRRFRVDARQERHDRLAGRARRPHGGVVGSDRPATQHRQRALLRRRRCRCRRDRVAADGRRCGGMLDRGLGSGQRPHRRPVAGDRTRRRPRRRRPTPVRIRWC